jgi:catecholate siderophore receptor
VDFENWYGLKDRDFENTKTSLATVQVDQLLSDNMSLRNTTRWGRTYRDSMITAPRFASSDSTDIRRSDEKYRDEQDDILSNITDLLLTLNPGAPWEHKILVGAEVSLENEKRYIQALTGVDSPTTDLFNPNPNDPYLENYQRTGAVNTADSTTFATYVSDSLQINESWQVNAGLRWDRFELEYTPDGTPMMERTDSMLSYRTGVVYKPVPEGTFYLGYGTSFNPTAEALSISTSSRSPGIADLEPEENRSLELGAKWELPESGLLLTAAVFRTDKTNARTQDPDDPNDLLVLEGEQRVQGVELGMAGNLLENLNVYAGYAYLETEVLESKNLSEVGQELANSPQHSINLWSSYNLSEDLQLGLGAQFVDDRYNNIANLRTAPSYWVYEASASYALSEKVGLQLNIQNLTDEDYVDYVGGGHFIPGLGRTALVSVNFRN